MSATVTNIAVAAARVPPEILAARGSVRSHCRSLGLTRGQEEACVREVEQSMRSGRSPAFAIGDANQMAQRFARPAARRIPATPFDPSPRPAA